VNYCGDKCREDHREQHDEECKKRAKELRDNILLMQPDGSATVNARSASCRCPLVIKNVHFIHAAANLSVMAANMPIS
jgi:hypothetical protein